MFPFGDSHFQVTQIERLVNQEIMNQLYYKNREFSGKSLQLGLVFCLLVYIINSLRCPITNLGHDRKRKTVTTEEDVALPQWFFLLFKFLFFPSFLVLRRRHGGCFPSSVVFALYI